MKKAFSQALVLVALALAAALVFHWWQNGGGAAKPLLAQTLSRASKQTSLPAPVFDGHPNRTTPVHAPLDSMPEVPLAPTDEQIIGSRLLPNTLWAVEGKGSDSARDNAAMAQLLAQLKDKQPREKYAAIQDWLAGHRDSRWYWSLTSQLMNYKWSQGYFDEAREGWLAAWNALKDSQDVNAYHLANDVVAHLLDTELGLARSATLRQLVSDVSDRPLNGALEGKLFRAREAVWLLDHTAAQNVMCGPLALNAIKDFLHEPFIAPRLSQVPPEFQATGLPLSEVQRFAQNDYNLPLKAMRRTDADSPIPTPAVMHVHDSHYSALLAASPDGSQYFMADRTLQFTGWVDKAAVNRLATGNFLVAAASNPGGGWQDLGPEQTTTIYGRDGAHGTVSTGQASTPQTPTTDNSDKNNCLGGMPFCTFHPMPGSLLISDMPVRYSPPVGPSVAFRIHYNDMDDGAPTSPPTFSNVGLTWSNEWVAWVEHVGSVYNGQQLHVHVPGGGEEVTTYNSTTSQFGPHDRSFAVVSRTGSYTYTRVLPDGSQEIYNSPDNASSPSRVFLTQLIDPQGNALTMGYDSNSRLVSVTDTIGQVTTLAYADANIYRITRVTDPFGRYASLSYDTGGRLVSITDMINLTSTFTYDATSGYIATMVTPYGTTQFLKTIDVAGSNRVIQVTDPQGDRERVEFNDTGSTFIPSKRSPPASIQVGGQTVPFFAEDTRLQFRNAWYWDKLAMKTAPGDYTAARNYRWFTDVNWLVTPVVEAVKPPLEDRVWIDYPGGVGSAGYLPYYLGQSAAPEKMLRMLEDGTPQLTQTYSNALGKVTKTIDPLGRTTEYDYAANMVDLLGVRQTTGGINETQAAITYNAQHLPATITNTAGSVTTYTYNARGQMLTVTNALNQTTALTYNASGYLVSVDGPLAGAADTTTITYDPQGRVRTATNSDGYTITYTYDGFDRVIQADYPDGTHERMTYDKLDRSSISDRLGRTTTYTYNAIQQLTSITDSLNRTMKMDWCRCGSLSSLTDAMGRTTRWLRDYEGRVTSKVYVDGSKVAFDYDGAVGRLSRRTDEKGQFKLYEYNADDSISRISYPNALVATPTVSFTYEAAYARTSSMTDGIGTTRYAYNPVTNGPAPGAGQVASVDGPFDHDTTAYTYDALGRPVSRTIDGVAAATVTRDAAGRTTSLTDPLGTFNFTYDGPTNRVLSMTRPNNVTTFYQYHDNLGDRRLKEIKHQRVSDSSIISQFDYTYDALGRILTWAQGQDGGTPDVWAMGYDNGGQLASVNVTRAGSPVTSYAYTYDAAGNRLSKTEGGVVTSFQYNSANEVASVAPPMAAASQAWDGENRLVSVTQGDLGMQFLYDGNGRCRRMKTLRGGKVVSDKSYVWAEAERVQERDSLSSTVTRQYLSQGELASPGTTSQAPLFVTTDHLGSIREATGANAALGQRYSYKPFGEMAATETGSIAPAFGYAGYFAQSDGTFQTTYRTYNPQLGRWTSRDPVAESGGINLFGYVNNDPINETDPFGLWFGWDDAVFTGGGALIGLIGQGVSDIMAGKLSRWEDYAGSAVGGAVAGEATLYMGPVGAGALGGLAGNLTKQGLKNLTHHQCGFDWVSPLVDTGVGALAGRIEGPKIKGITSGRGSDLAVFRQIVTKARNGTIKSIGADTAVTMFKGAAVDGLGATLGAADFGGYQSALEGQLPSWLETSETRCPCKK